MPFDASTTEEIPRYRAVTRSNVHKTPQWSKLRPEMREAIEVVSQVLPFHTNPYVMNALIDWDAVAVHAASTGALRHVAGEGDHARSCSSS